MKEGKRNVKGQGHFEILDDGKWRLRKSVGVKTDGKRKVLTVTANSKSTCIKLMKEKEALWEKEKNQMIALADDTVEDLCTKHLETQIANGDLKPKSIDRREGTIKNQIGAYPIGHYQVNSVTPADIEEHVGLLINSGLSASSVKKTLDVLNAAYEWARNRGDMVNNPVSSIKKTLMKRIGKIENKEAAEADVIVFSEDEASQFEREAISKFPNGKYKYAGGLYGRLLLHTGLRVGELISLEWADYDEKSKILTIDKNTTMVKNRDKKDGENNYVSSLGTVKNQKARIIQLTDEAIEDLRLIYEIHPGNSRNLICRTRNEKPYTATMLEHCMKTIYQNLGFDEQVSGLHIFRRTFATRMYENGAGIKDIAAYIGDLESTTMRYYIAARRKYKVGVFTKQVVPVPGAKGQSLQKENPPAGNRGI